LVEVCTGIATEMRKLEGKITQMATTEAEQLEFAKPVNDAINKCLEWVTKFTQRGFLMHMFSAAGNFKSLADSRYYESHLYIHMSFVGDTSDLQSLERGLHNAMSVVHLQITNVQVRWWTFKRNRRRG